MPIIVFEGIDFSGKTTQANLLRQHLHNSHIKANVYHEPGGTPLSEKIRELLLGSVSPIDTTTKLMLFLASRSDLTQNILMKRHPDEMVILDRYIDSTIVYQGIAQGDDANFIHMLCDHVTNSIMPDMTFYIQIDTRTFAERVSQSLRKFDALDKEAISGVTNIINAYNLWYNTLLEDKIRDNVYILDGTKPVDMLHQEIVTIVRDKYVNRQ